MVAQATGHSGNRAGLITHHTTRLDLLNCVWLSGGSFQNYGLFPASAFLCRAGSLGVPIRVCNSSNQPTLGSQVETTPF